jgi:hypothetical protein
MKKMYKKISCLIVAFLACLPVHADGISAQVFASAGVAAVGFLYLCFINAHNSANIARLNVLHAADEPSKPESNKFPPLPDLPGKPADPTTVERRPSRINRDHALEAQRERMANLSQGQWFGFKFPWSK